RPAPELPDAEARARASPEGAAPVRLLEQDLERRDLPRGAGRSRAPARRSLDRHPHPDARERSVRVWTRGAIGARGSRVAARGGAESDRERSEEHTSELQSLTNLVCRLLLEKKKNMHLRDKISRKIEKDKPSDRVAPHAYRAQRDLVHDLRDDEQSAGTCDAAKWSHSITHAT